MTNRTVVIVFAIKGKKKNIDQKNLLLYLFEFLDYV